MSERPLRIFVAAGETSGDILGAQLMEALRGLRGGAVEFTGVGGARMTAAGLTSLFPIDDIAVMGLVDILPRARTLLARIQATAEFAAKTNPDVAVLIDAPGFNHRVAIRLKAMAPHVPVAIYVAPQVWAWRPGRAKNMLHYVDHVLALLPFEPQFFQKVGLRCTHVGHPVVERFPGGGLGPAFRARHGIAPEAPVLAVLPGSRRKEVSRLLPIFRPTLTALAERHRGLVAVVPTVPHVADMVSAAMADWPVRAIIAPEEADKYPAFESANVALAASGTVALELALAGTPMVIAYKVDPVTAFLVRHVVTVEYANLINLIENRLVVPEFIQEKCTVETLVAATHRLLSDPEAQAAQRTVFEKAAEALGLGQEAPSVRAAKAVLATLVTTEPEFVAQ